MDIKVYCFQNHYVSGRRRGAVEELDRLGPRKSKRLQNIKSTNTVSIIPGGDEKTRTRYLTKK